MFEKSMNKFNKRFCVKNNFILKLDLVFHEGALRIPPRER